MKVIGPKRMQPIIIEVNAATDTSFAPKRFASLRA
jgi:hypothetical protein